MDTFDVSAPPHCGSTSSCVNVNVLFVPIHFVNYDVMDDVLFYLRDDAVMG